MTKCVFCGTEEPIHMGVNLIKNDGTVDFYCSSKCRKNSLKLGRDKKKLKWTEAYRLQRTKYADATKKADAKIAESKEAKKVADAKAVESAPKAK